MQFTTRWVKRKCNVLGLADFDNNCQVILINTCFIFNNDMTKVLTDYEMQLVTNSEVLLTKNRIIKKVYELFGTLCQQYKDVLQSSRFSTLNDIDPKISRGENYQELPYVILDYPRLFSKTDVFAVRTFFWWGNFFSITLQVSGVHQLTYADAIEKAIKAGVFEGWSISCGDDQWQHHFEAENYTAIQSERNYEIAKRPFVKIAKKIPLNKWDEANDFFKESFLFLIKVLSS